MDQTVGFPPDTPRTRNDTVSPALNATEFTISSQAELPKVIVHPIDVADPFFMRVMVACSFSVDLTNRFLNVPYAVRQVTRLAAESAS